MMRDELYINGIKVELSDDTGVVLNFAAGDPSDMTAIASGSSYTVSLPLTAHNIQTLGFINHPGSTSDIPNKEHTARLVRGGIPIFENGKATVSGVGKTIDILLTWNRSDELEALSRAKMRDMAITDVMRMDSDNFELSETAYLKWIWNTGYVVNARSGGLGYDVRGFRPAVKVSWLLGRMLPAFSIRADYWAFIERQWIMLPTMLGNSDILSKIGFSLSGSYNYNTSEDKKPDALNRVGSSYTPLAGGYNLYFPQINSRVEHDYIYTPKRGSYRFQGSVNASMASNSSASFKIIKNRTITTDRDGNAVEEYETLFEQTLNGSLVSFDTTKELEEGDKIGIIVSYATAASNTVTLNMNVTFDALTAANTNTAYLLDYPIRENLPEISMLDFVKGVFGTIGLMTEHTIDGLHMFTADDVILSTDRKDISGMLIDEKETKLTFSRGLTKYNTLGYKDKTDYITFPADTYDKTEHAVVTLPFVLQDTTMYTKGDDKYNLTEGKDARLLLNDGTKSIQIAKRPTNGAVFTYRTLTLSSFTISGLEFETLADTFWRGYIGAFSVSPRIVTKRARLTPDFVQGLSFSKAIYDGQNYYMLLRVSDYNKHGLATLEMALIDGIELESVDLTNVILDGSGGVILFDGTTPALYEPPVGGSGSVSGKLIRELEEYTGEITEDIYIPIDLSNGPARKRKLFNIAHSHVNKPILDLITQGHLDVLSHFSVEEGRIKVNTDLWSTGEVSAYGAGSGDGTGGAVGSLGGLTNVGLWADEVPASDRIMVQLAGATHWSSMLLSEIVGLDTNALANYLTTNNYATKNYVTEEISKLNIHTHENKTLLDLITQGNIDVLSHLSIVDGRLKADVDFYSTGEVSAYGAGTGTGGGAVGSLGGLANVGLWADEVPASDRIMVQLAGATHWSSKLLSEIVGLDTVALNTYLTTNNYATQSYVSTKIAELVGTAPTTLDTLNELAAALGNDPNFATSMSTLIGTKWTQDNTKIANWDSAYSALHSHANKSVLDGITADLVTNWNLAYTNNHTHPNKSIIDSLTQANLDVLAKLSIVDGNLKVDTNLWSTGEVSAYGAGSGTGGGGTGLITSVLGSSGLGGSYLDSDLTNTFNAYTINLINNNLTGALGRIGALETSTPNVAWGTPTSQYSPLTINSITRNLSLDGHTHSYMPISGGNFTDHITVLGHTVWHAGNDGAGSGLDADTVDGFHVGAGSNWGYIPSVEVNGVMEIGKYIDFHSSSPNNLDYSTRLTAVGSSQNEIYLPVNNGTLALITDNVASATKLANTRTIWGQSFNGEGNVSGAINNATTGNFSSTLFTSVGLKSRNICIETDNAGNAATQSSEINNYNSSLFLQASTSNNVVLVLGGGSVGVGTPSPSYKLDVNGSFRSVGATFLNSTLSVTGTSTLTGLLTANGGIGSTTGTFSSYVTAQRFYTGYDSGQANSISCSNWFRSNGSSGWYNDTYGVGINSDTANIVRTYSINKFKVYNTESDSIYTLGGLKSDQTSTLKGISVTNGSYAKGISIGFNSHLQMDGVVSSYTYTLPATIGWYRVAVSPSGVERPFGQFDISWTLSSYHGAVSITAGTMFSSAPFVSQSAYTNFGVCITKSRIVYHPSYPGNYAYLEIYNETGKAVALTVRGYNLTGWTLYSASTVGSIPSGYSNKEISHTEGYMTSGNVAALGEITAYSASDIRLKTEVVSLTNSLQIIQALNPVSYKWNSIAKELNPLKDNNTDYGLIAQELESVMPELVHTVYGQYKSVDYIKIIPHLICAIKQLKMEIDHLKKTYY